jgi:hypothetical protein
VNTPGVRRTSGRRTERTQDDSGPTAAGVNRPPRAFESVHDAAAVEHAGSVESALAGSFFLINVATGLGLYSHGIVACEDIDIGIWRFIEIATVNVLREVDEHDPLWRLLRQLSNPADDVDTVVPERRTTRRERRLLRRVREHVSAALAVDDAGRVLVQRPGWIARSPAHLDVHFALDRHPFVIRQARLDRNPGWIPAAGVHVAFHFN